MAAEQSLELCEKGFTTQHWEEEAQGSPTAARKVFFDKIYPAIFKDFQNSIETETDEIVKAKKAKQINDPRSAYEIAVDRFKASFPKLLKIPDDVIEGFCHRNVKAGHDQACFDYLSKWTGFGSSILIRGIKLMVGGSAQKVVDLFKKILEVVKKANSK